MRRQSLFSTVHTYSLLMNLKNFVCNIGEDAELLMSIYDPDQSEVIRSGLAPPPHSGAGIRGPERPNPRRPACFHRNRLDNAA